MLERCIYIAGPMTNLPEYNYPEFRRVAKWFRLRGWLVENPAENPQCNTWAGYMRMSLVQISRCDHICLLPGWWRSRGARLEALIAWYLGLTFVGHPK